jgi:hypothetical protein
MKMRVVTVHVAPKTGQKIQMSFEILRTKKKDLLSAPNPYPKKRKMTTTTRNHTASQDPKKMVAHKMRVVWMRMCRVMSTQNA